MSISLNRNAETLIKSVICTDLLYTIVNEQGKPTITGYEISDTNNNSFSDKRGIKRYENGRTNAKTLKQTIYNRDQSFLTY